MSKQIGAMPPGLVADWRSLSSLIEATELRHDVDRNTADIHAIQLKLAATDAAPRPQWRTISGRRKA